MFKKIFFIFLLAAIWPLATAQAGTFSGKVNFLTYPGIEGFRYYIAATEEEVDAKVAAGNYDGETPETFVSVSLSDAGKGFWLAITSLVTSGGEVKEGEAAKFYWLFGDLVDTFNDGVPSTAVAINFPDILTISVCYGKPASTPGCALADFDHDGWIRFPDILLISVKNGNRF